MRLIADLSAVQTAELLGVAVATVHVHLHRALITLREQSAELEVTP
jgi:DNA-directed RNA polymerase specialized sigma24 family protein